MSAVLDTVYSACSAEFSPYHSHLLALGLYQIAPDDDQASASADSPATKRLGRCLLLDTSNDSFSELSRMDMPAILDMKWSLLGGHPVLAVAHAKGGVVLLSVTEDRTLKKMHESVYTDPSTLTLSLDWSNRKHSNFEAGILLSNSAGSIHILSGPELDTEHERWEAHTFEPWIAAWDCWSRTILYTGGDDCLLKGWDRRQGFEAPTFTNKRFDAGVTAIQSHSNDENRIAVGSYDAQLRIFDKRNMMRPVAQGDVGGGIWRVKWNPLADRRDDVLVACMHDGFKVLRHEGALVTRIENKEHESLAYGADWESEGSQVASASFYDHTARLWQG